MGRLVFGRLSEAWLGEATDFTPLLVDRLDQLGQAIDLDLASAGRSEVYTAGGRRIDIVAQGADGSEFVIENQYGRADHDHLTRGLAYAVARSARGLVVVAEEHRDEFRAVAQYLNDLSELDPERGIAVWLVEARAVRVDDGPWAPLFSPVVEPNRFTMAVEQAKVREAPATLEDFLDLVESLDVREAISDVVDEWERAGFRRRLRPNHVVLEAPGPSVSGRRAVVSISAQGAITVPLGSYRGQNTGVPVEDLCSEEFRDEVNRLFGFASDKDMQTEPAWVRSDRRDPLLAFCTRVANAYASAMAPRGNVSGTQGRAGAD